MTAHGYDNTVPREPWSDDYGSPKAAAAYQQRLRAALTRIAKAPAVGSWAGRYICDWCGETADRKQDVKHADTCPVSIAAKALDVETVLEVNE